MKIKIVIATILIIFFSLFARAQDDFWGNIKHGSSYSIGNMEQYDDGVSSYKIGNTKYYSNGDYETTIGNTTYDSDGNYSCKSGNWTFRSDGNSGYDIGNYHYYDNNTITKMGNWKYK